MNATKAKNNKKQLHESGTQDAWVCLWCYWLYTLDVAMGVIFYEFPKNFVTLLPNLLMSVVTTQNLFFRQLISIGFWTIVLPGKLLESFVKGA
jgi:hypothetical protein